MPCNSIGREVATIWDQDHDREEYPAVQHVIGLGCLGTAQDMAERYDAQRAQTIGNDRHDYRDQDEYRAADRGTIHHQCIQAPKGQSGYQEAQTRTGFGDQERSNAAGLQVYIAKPVVLSEPTSYIARLVEAEKFILKG